MNVIDVDNMRRCELTTAQEKTIQNILCNEDIDVDIDGDICVNEDEYKRMLKFIS